MAREKGLATVRRLALAAFGFSMFAGAASAGDAPYGELGASPLYPYNTFEARLGAYAHDPQSPEGGAADISVEFLFPKFANVSNPWLNMLIPRAHIGATGSFVGKTSILYSGVVWDFDLYRGFFIEGSFDGAANNGKVGATVPAGFNAMGCNATFHESGSLGYHVTQHWSVLATIEHSSNADLCDRNRGLTNVGGRIGYTF